MRVHENGHHSFIIWLTGLSGAGKSSIADELERQLFSSGHKTYVLDGDNIHHGLCGDLGFTRTDREENIRHIGEVAKILIDTGIIVAAAFISPYKADRDRVREKVSDKEFVEVYCRCDIKTRISRDQKGLYKLALAGEIQDFTGISAPYQTPENPELTLDTGVQDIACSTIKIIKYLQQRGLLLTKTHPAPP